MVLQNYRSVVKGLGNYLGETYEIVLHSLGDFQHSVVYINHDEYTGRKVGALITNKTLNFLVKSNENSSKQETYYSVSAKGEPLKSATIAIKGENDRIIDLLCMNFYMNISFYDFIHTFVQKGALTAENDSAAETFASNVDDMITSALNTVGERIYNNPAIGSSSKNKGIIYDLCNKGVFQVKDAAAVIAKFLNISKNTVCLRLRKCGSHKFWYHVNTSV